MQVEPFTVRELRALTLGVHFLTHKLKMAHDLQRNFMKRIRVQLN